MNKDAMGQRKRKPGVDDWLIHGIPTPLKNRFKAACNIAGVPMKHVVIGFMKQYIKLQFGRVREEG
jgi:hypothetical protein